MFKRRACNKFEIKAPNVGIHCFILYLKSWQLNTTHHLSDVMFLCYLVQNDTLRKLLHPKLRNINPHNITSSSYYSSSSSSGTCWILVHACATSSGKAKWSGPHQRRWEENAFKFHSVTRYIDSSVSLIHVNTTKIRNITCTLVATCVILWSVECIALCNSER